MYEGKFANKSLRFVNTALLNMGFLALLAEYNGGEIREVICTIISGNEPIRKQNFQF